MNGSKSVIVTVILGADEMQVNESATRIRESAEFEHKSCAASCQSLVNGVIAELILARGNLPLNCKVRTGTIERLDCAVRRVVERIIVTEGFDYKVKTRVSGGGVERGLVELLERDAVSTRGGASEQWNQAHENAKKEQRDE